MAELTIELSEDLKRKMAELPVDWSVIIAVFIREKVFEWARLRSIVDKSKLTEDEIFYNLKKGFQGVKDLKKRIMVTHIHPEKSIIEKFSRFVAGSKSVRKAIDEFKPDILICGHVHEAEGLEEQIGNTKVINVSKSGMIIEV